jgi:hypothetical protein
MLGFRFYLEKTENIGVVGQHYVEALTNFVKELYDTAFLKIAESKTVDLGTLNNQYYEAECKYWKTTPDPEEMQSSYEESVIMLTDVVRIFLTTFISERIAAEAKSFAEDMPKLTIEQISHRGGFIGRLSDLLKTVQDRRYGFFVID